jgi:hypothetical protein
VNGAGLDVVRITCPQYYAQTPTAVKIYA